MAGYQADDAAENEVEEDQSNCHCGCDAERRLGDEPLVEQDGDHHHEAERRVQTRGHQTSDRGCRGRQQQPYLEHLRPVIGDDVADIFLASVDRPGEVEHRQGKGDPADDIGDALDQGDSQPAHAHRALVRAQQQQDDIAGGDHRRGVEGAPEAFDGGLEIDHALPVQAGQAVGPVEGVCELAGAQHGPITEG